MKGVFEIYIKRPKKGEVVILPPEVDPMQEQQKFPDMKDSDKFDYEHVKDVEIPREIFMDIANWWYDASFGDEFIIRCELPV